MDTGESSTASVGTPTFSTGLRSQSGRVAGTTSCTQSSIMMHTKCPCQCHRLREQGSRGVMLQMWHMHQIGNCCKVFYLSGYACTDRWPHDVPWEFAPSGAPFFVVFFFFDEVIEKAKSSRTSYPLTEHDGNHPTPRTPTVWVRPRQANSSQTKVREQTREQSCRPTSNSTS